jgi:hypothetical protein
MLPLLRFHPSGFAWRWPRALWFAAASLLILSGCRSSSDLVEAELRTKERQLREVKEELNRTELYNEALNRELRDVRPGVPLAPTPELASQLYTIKEVVLGRLTGGYDEDGLPGDEALQVVLEPRDPDGHAIKVPGSLHIEVHQISREGLKIPLSTWDIPPDQLRRSWRSGLFSTGYQLVLPWKVWPSTPKLRVTARFTLADNRVFEADKDITVRLAPEGMRGPKPHAPVESLPIPLIPEPETPLGYPRVIEMKKPAGQSWLRKPQPGETWQPAASPSLREAVRILPPAPLGK